MGLTGGQVLEENQNKTLYDSNENGVNVYLFEVYTPGEYTFIGQVALAEEPFQTDEELGLPKQSNYEIQIRLP